MNNKKLSSRIKDLFNAFAQDYNLLYPQWDEVDSNIAKGIDNYIKRQEIKVNKILDLGSGTGIGTLGLSALGYDVSCIDISPRMLKVLGEKAKRKKTKLNIIEGDITDLDKIVNGKFDMVVCRGNTITYLAESNIEKTLRKIYNLLNPGGIVYLGLREWESLLNSNDHSITHLSRVPLEDGILYDCYYTWKEVNTPLIPLEVLFYFYRDDKVTSFINKKIYSVEFFPHKINWLLEILKEVDFRDIKIANIPEEKMDGEEYTIISGTR